MNRRDIADAEAPVVVRELEFLCKLRIWGARQMCRMVRWNGSTQCRPHHAVGSRMADSSCALLRSSLVGQNRWGREYR